jgi:hypothetical protein
MFDSIKDANQIIGITVSVVIIIEGFFLNKRRSKSSVWTTDWLILLLTFISIALLIGYIVWGSSQSEWYYAWGFTGLSIGLFIFILFRLSHNLVGNATIVNNTLVNQ